MAPLAKVFFLCLAVATFSACAVAGEYDLSDNLDGYLLKGSEASDDYSEGFADDYEDLSGAQAWDIANALEEFFDETDEPVEGAPMPAENASSMEGEGGDTSQGDDEPEESPPPPPPPKRKPKKPAKKPKKPAKKSKKPAKTSKKPARKSKKPAKKSEPAKPAEKKAMANGGDQGAEDAAPPAGYTVPVRANWPFNDVGDKGPGLTIQACADICDATLGCAFFFRRDGDGYCWFKSAANGFPTGGNAVGDVSGLTFQKL